MLLRSQNKESKTSKKGIKMKYGKVGMFGAIFAFVFMIMACFAPSAMAVTAGSVTVDGLTASDEVKANSAEITLNATGTDINQIDFYGGDSLNSLVLLESFEYTGTNTSVEEVYEWVFETQGEKVYKLAIEDNGTWDNTTIGAFTVSTYIIPMANSDSMLYNLLAFVALFVVIYLVMWLFWLRKDDKTSAGEKREQNKDATIAIVVALVVSVIVFMFFGGMLSDYIDIVAGWFGY